MTVVATNDMTDMNFDIFADNPCGFRNKRVACATRLFAICFPKSALCRIRLDPLSTTA